MKISFGTFRVGVWGLVACMTAHAHAGCGDDGGGSGGGGGDSGSPAEPGGQGCFFTVSKVCEVYQDPNEPCFPPINEPSECSTVNLEGICRYRDPTVGPVIAHYYPVEGKPWSQDGRSAKDDCASLYGTYAAQ